jgi:signal transduction histidine kinase
MQRTALQGGRLVLEVHDDGRGLEAHAHAAAARGPAQGLALNNIRQRLQGRYGNAASLHAVRHAEPGTLARITLPIAPLLRTPPPHDHRPASPTTNPTCPAALAAAACHACGRS